MTATSRALPHASLDQDRIDWHLWNWERWMQCSRSPGLMPSRSSGFAGCGQDFDASLDNLDRSLGEACDRCIRDLPPVLRLAVHAHHGVALWRGDNTGQLYEQACEQLGRSLYLRGMV